MKTVYCIANLVNGCVYIGATQDFALRVRQHTQKLERGAHINRRLQRDWDADGADNFEFRVIGVWSSREAHRQESRWIAEYNATDPHFGYNEPAAHVPTASGHIVFTPDEVRAIRAAYAGGQTYKALAQAYGVSPAAIRKIVIRRNYQHVD